MSAPFAQLPLDMPGSGQQSGLLNGNAAAYPLAMFTAAKNNQIQLPLGGVAMVSLYNRTPHTLYAELDGSGIGNAFPLLLECDTAKHVAFPQGQSLNGITITDLTQNLGYLPGVLREGKSVARRAGSRLPYTQGSPTATGDGQLLLVTSTISLAITETIVTPLPPVNFSQQLLTTGILVSKAALTLNPSTIIAAGFFIGCHVFNSIVNSTNVQCTYLDASGNGTATQQYPPGYNGYEPVECDKINVTGPASNMCVNAYQPVIYTPSTD